MKRDRQVIAVCMLTTCSLTLLVMMLAFFGYPHVNWRLLRRILWILALSELCAAMLGYGLGRFATANLTAALDEEQSRLRLYLSETGHELRTPLAVMQGSVDILRRSMPQADVAVLSVLDGLTQEITRLSDLVQKVLLLARLDVMRRPIARRLDVSHALEGLAVWTRDRSPSTPIELVSEPGLAATIDEAAFLEAIRNLLDNALRHAPGASVCIRARREKEYIVIEVADDGPGMDDEDAALAFERYYRGNGAGGIPGSGLGLSIVRSMAERHGGAATIASGVGKGTTVTLSVCHEANKVSATKLTS